MVSTQQGLFDRLWEPPLLPSTADFNAPPASLQIAEWQLEVEWQEVSALLKHGLLPSVGTERLSRPLFLAMQLDYCRHLHMQYTDRLHPIFEGALNYNATLMKNVDAGEEAAALMPLLSSWTRRMQSNLARALKT